MRKIFFVRDSDGSELLINSRGTVLRGFVLSTKPEEEALELNAWYDRDCELWYER